MPFVSDRIPIIWNLVFWRPPTNLYNLVVLFVHFQLFEAKSKKKIHTILKRNIFLPSFAYNIYYIGLRCISMHLYRTL